MTSIAPECRDVDCLAADILPGRTLVALGLRGLSEAPSIGPPGKAQHQTDFVASLIVRPISARENHSGA